MNEFGELTPEKLSGIEVSLMELPPMTMGTDTLLRDFYLYATGELRKITPSLKLPATIYLRAVADLGEVEEVYQHINGIIVNSIKARGRDHTGQLGEYFWEQPLVPDLYDNFKGVGSAIQQAYETLNPDKARGTPDISHLNQPRHFGSGML